MRRFAGCECSSDQHKLHIPRIKGKPIPKRLPAAKIAGPDVSIYEVRPRRDRRGFDLISDALPFGRLWYTEPDDAIGYARFCARSHDAVIRVYDEAGNVIATHEHAGEFKEW